MFLTGNVAWLGGKAEKDPYFDENDTPIYTKIDDTVLKSLSNVPKIDFKTSSNAQQYNLSSNQEKALNETNFITLGNLSEDEKIEIIKLGFQLQAQGKYL